MVAGLSNKNGRLKSLLMVSLFSAGLVACATKPADSTSSTEPAVPDRFEAETQLSFDEWLQAFRAEAIAQGISANTYDTAIAGIKLNDKVLQSNAFQPEFTKQIWDYMDGAVSDYRITKAREKFGQHRALFDEIENAYGVQSNYVLAIWGLESSFGSFLGDIYLIEALATLGYQGRRTAYGREQLIAALKILENGYATRSQLKGSWAGAMGHTQFIPTTYLGYAIDHNNDKRRDLWSSLDDVFASTSNYLSKSDWTPGQRWGVEVKLPNGFDYTLADKSIVRTVSDWQTLGITGAGAEALSKHAQEEGSVLVPAGHKGPAFIVFNNFKSILRYNNSTSYALAVGHLAERIKGAPPFAGTWPRSETALSLTEREDTQRLLNELGYDSGEVDGVIGAQTRSAARNFQKTKGLPADGFVSRALLALLRQTVTN